MDTLAISIDQQGVLLKLHALYAINEFTLSYTVIPPRGTNDNRKALNLYFEVLITFSACSGSL